MVSSSAFYRRTPANPRPHTQSNQEHRPEASHPVEGMEPAHGIEQKQHAQGDQDESAHRGPGRNVVHRFGHGAGSRWLSDRRSRGGGGAAAAAPEPLEAKRIG